MRPLLSPVTGRLFDSGGVTNPRADRRFSVAGGHDLTQKAAALVSAVEEHTAAVLALPHCSNELLRLSDLNRTVSRAVAAWDDAVFGYTGTFAVGVDFDEEEDETR